MTLLKTRLIEANECVLVVIDMQDSFFNKYEREKSQAVISKTAWLIRAANSIGIPIVPMAEDIPNSGPLNEKITAALPAEAHVFNKDVFGCGDQPEILEAIKATGRNTAVLVGMETDVCVAHSALSLMGKGYDVVVVADATITTAADQEIGLMRIRDAGGVLCSVKSIYYEWLRSVSGCYALLDVNTDLEARDLPPTVVL
ncbi:MAG: isochorismatase family protein [Roseovarius sp.]